jgi:1-acyl-sn-glycerol-3-phosphate acyltransferase
LDTVSRALITAWCYFVFALGLLLWAVVVIPLTLVLIRFWPGVRDCFSDSTQFTIAIYVKLLPMLRVSVDRSKRLSEQSTVLVVNHQSWLDPVVMLSIEPRLSGPARGYLFRVPIMRTILKIARFYVSDRSEPAHLERMRQGVVDALDRRGTLLFFPEGTRTRNGEIGAFHLGAFRMAVEFKLPIQPVVIDGLHHVFPADSPIVKARWRYLVKVRYLSPIEPPYAEGPHRKVVRELAQQARLQMIGELDRLGAERNLAGWN